MLMGRAERSAFFLWALGTWGGPPLPLTAEIQMPTLESASVNLQRILLATDFGPVSEAALRYTLAIARRYAARLYLLHVLRPTDQRSLDDAWRDAQRYMTELFISGQLDGVDNQLVVEQGDVWEVVSRKIEALRIDLLAIGTHGRTGLGKLLLGSLAETIFRQAPCPVLMVGPKAAAEPPPSLQRILFCTGFSAHSLKAGGYALALAERQGACLTLLHVIKDPPLPGAERDHAAEAARARLAALIPDGTRLACPPEFAVEFGPPGERILAVAAQRRANLIVLGVRQPAGFARRFKWATAYEVVTSAPCPVLTVRMTQLE